MAGKRTVEIDLTADSDSDDVIQVPKRSRIAGNTRPIVMSPAPSADSSDVLIVDDVEDTAATNAPGPASDSAGLAADEELVVTGDVGDIALRDYPHCRADCCVHKLCKNGGPANVSFCGQCYCFVCDVKASECQFWGSGLATQHHCNAHSTGYWIYLRGLCKQGKSAALQTEYAKCSGPGQSGNALAKLSQAIASSQRAHAAQNAAALKDLPDPSKDNSMLLLGTISLTCKAATGSIADLQPRIKRFGVELPNNYCSHSSSGTDPLAGVLTLENLPAMAWDQSCLAMRPQFLELEPLALSGPAPPSPSTRRHRKVTLALWSQGRLPVTLGVDVETKASVEDIAKAALELAEALPGVRKFDPLTEEMLAFGYNERQRLVTQGFMENARPPDEFFLNDELWLFRVPRAASQPDGQRGMHVLVQNYCPEAVLGGATTEQPWLSPIKVHTLHAGVMRVIGTPVSMPLKPSWLNAGRGTHTEMVHELQQLLKPARAAGNGGVARAQFELYRMAWGWNNLAAEERQKVSSPLNKLQPMMGRFVVLAAKWTNPEQCGYSLEAFGLPHRHASLDMDKLKEAERLYREQRALLEDEMRRKRQPYDLLEELRVASRTFTKGSFKKPVAAVVIDLAPKGSDPKDGTLSLQVYTKGTPGPDSVLQPFDSWPQQRVPHHMGGRDGRCELPLTLELLARGGACPGVAEVLAAQQRWRVRSAEVRSMQNIIDLMVSGERPEAPQPAGLRVELRPYQRQSLAFMQSCEESEGGFRSRFWLRMHTPSGRTLWYSPLLQRLSPHVPELPWGGHLAEEMGLGKTVEVLALVLSRPAPTPLPAPPRALADLVPSRATLVVCALSLVGQWLQEAKNRLAANLSMHKYHGNKRERDAARLAHHDLVVTTYATLGSDWHSKGADLGTRGSASPLHKIYWHRVVFDEGHNLKGSSSALIKASVSLHAARRWVCTGTPISNAVDDLQGQLAGMGLAPLNQRGCFDAVVKAPAMTCPATAAALMPLLEQVMIRHTKDQVLGGEQVSQLPPLTERSVSVTLSAEERRRYLAAHEVAAGHWAALRGRGAAAVSSHLLQAMSLLLPLRRMCSGGMLLAEELMPNRFTGAAGRIMAQDAARPDPSLVAPAEECSICLDVLEAPTVTACQHWFCGDCISTHLAQHATCPLCRASIRPGGLRLGVSFQDGAAGAAPTAAAGAAGAVLFESKANALVSELDAMRRCDPGLKALVFTQFTATLTHLKAKLHQAGYRVHTINGQTSQSARASALEAFSAPGGPASVFVLSLRAGGVGVNLAGANAVFLTEPCLNPALEEQAVGRAHRMGQTRPVTVTRLVVQGSVEERMMEVVRSRRHSGAAAAGVSGAACGSAGAAAAAAAAAAAPVPGAAGPSSAGAVAAAVAVEGPNGAAAEMCRESPRAPPQGDAEGAATGKQQLRFDELELLFSTPQLL